MSTARPEPTPTSVDWPQLVALAERHRVPVGRVDDEGHLVIIRTVAQLAEEWES